MNIDLVLNEIVRRTITGLVKLDLSQDFFVSDTRIIKTAIRLLKDDNVLISHGMSEADIETDENYQKFSHRSDLRAQILSSLNQVELNVTAETIFEAIGYDEENIKDIFSSIPSEFDTLSFDDKKMLFFLTLCRCREIPISSLIYSNAFTLKDFFKLAKFALSITDKILKEIISHLREASFLRYDRKNEIFMITNNFDFELERLSSFPKIEKFKMAEYEVSITVPFGDIINVINDSMITSFRSEVNDGVSSFVYSLLLDHKIKFWYVDRDINTLLRIIDQSRKLVHPCSPIIWIDNYQEVLESEEEKNIFKIISCAHAKVLISGHSFENPFGTDPVDVTLKSDCLPERVKHLFPEEELSSSVTEYLNRCCLTGNMKKSFIKDLFNLYTNCNYDSKYILKLLPDFQRLYDHQNELESESDLDYENDGKHSTDISFVTVLEPNDILDEELIYDSQLSIQLDEITTLASAEGYKKFKEVSRDKPLTCMFIGYPGTGKSAICKAIAKKTKRPLWWIEAGKLMDTMIGGTEQKITSLFEAYNLQTEISDSFPILLFNECDSLMQTRIDNPRHGSEISYNTVNSILLDNIERCKGILFATSNMKNFDEAYSRRFIYKLHFEQPKNEFLIQLYHKFLPGLSDQQYKILLQYKISPDEIRTVQMKRELYNFFHNNIECDFSYIELCIKNMKFIPENTNSIGFQ